MDLSNQLQNLTEKELQDLPHQVANELQRREEQKKPIYGKFLVAYNGKYNKGIERGWKVEIKGVRSHLRWFKTKKEAIDFINYAENNNLKL